MLIPPKISIIYLDINSFLSKRLFSSHISILLLFPFRVQNGRRSFGSYIKSTIKNREQNISLSTFIRKTLEPSSWHCSGSFTLNFEQISSTFLVFAMLTLKIFYCMVCFSEYIFQNLFQNETNHLSAVIGDNCSLLQRECNPISEQQAR